ncbi:MAG: PD40 domain-containing protein [Phycisphaerales bacterium]|nr:PD40 domain-containing protein [Phycisphaerales bacterium]
MKSTILTAIVCTTSLCSGALASNPNPDWDADWEKNEERFLSDYVQLTSELDFLKAGESYFSLDGTHVIFQGIPVPKEGEEPNPYYSMYIAQFEFDADKIITGLTLVSAISEPGSSNTCGWFHPTKHNTILFSSTRIPPATEDVTGYQRGGSSYSWKFPTEMEILAGTFELTMKDTDEGPEGISIEDFTYAMASADPIWKRDGYDAEGSWSPDGRYILYTKLEPGGANGDIWLYDSKSGEHTALITADGYDGGPFFSPDMKAICYRSDRRNDQLLQIYTAYLKYDDEGNIIGIKQEVAITDNEHVNWAPFYTVDGRYLLYSTSEQGHGNYEVYAVDASGDYSPEETPRLRVTQARGFDGLPAFSRDGKWMIWTAQRGAYVEGQDRPSSQLWAAKLDLRALHWAYVAAREELLGENMDTEPIKRSDPHAGHDHP